MKTTLSNRKNCFVLLALLAMTVVWVAPANGADRRPRFYLTPSTYTGSLALHACGPKFHMASLLEIYEVSNLRYDRALGLTNTDSGSGAPTASIGWVRTGYTGNPFGSAGLSNCLAWSSSNSGHFGTIAEIPADWASVQATQVGLWSAGTSSCGSRNHVWCVQY